MATSQLTHPLTYDDLRQMPDDLNRYEIINGELLVSPAPSLAHQLVSVQLFTAVFAHVQQHELGTVLYAPVDVRLGAHDVVEPDTLFLSHERFEKFRTKGTIDGPPDLVIEIISPSSSSVDAIGKAALYARVGVPEYWLPAPEKRSFRMLVLKDGVYHDIQAVDGCLHSTVLDGLVIDPDALFANLA